MLLMMIEKGMPIDEIIYCNVMATPYLGGDFPEMYVYIKKIEKHIGRKITFVQAALSFEEQFYTEYKEESVQGRFMVSHLLPGFPGVMTGLN